MCCNDRKIPAAIVGTLACFTLLLSFIMLGFAVRFNNSGITADMGDMGDYANDAFFGLAGAAALALLCSVCGLCTCCCKKRCCTVVLGCTLLPAAILICGFGMTLTSVSHTNEAELQEFCDEFNEEGYEEMTKRDKGAQKIRETISEVDIQLGQFVTSRMCSNICPCDLEFKDDKIENQNAWLAVFADSEKLKSFDRCLMSDPDCELEKQIIYTTATGPTVLEMTGFEVEAFNSFYRCFEDL